MHWLIETAMPEGISTSLHGGTSAPLFLQGFGGLEGQRAGGPSGAAELLLNLDQPLPDQHFTTATAASQLQENMHQPVPWWASQPYHRLDNGWLLRQSHDQLKLCIFTDMQQLSPTRPATPHPGSRAHKQALLAGQASAVRLGWLTHRLSAQHHVSVDSPTSRRKPVLACCGDASVV